MDELALSLLQARLNDKEEPGQGMSFLQEDGGDKWEITTWPITQSCAIYLDRK